MTSTSKTLNRTKEEKKESAARSHGTKSWIREWAEFLVTLAIMVFFIRATTIEAFRIPTGSMEDTLLVGDFLLVNKFIYGIRTPDWIGIPFTKIGFSIPSKRLAALRRPQQGDVVVFRYPRQPSVNYVKRCVAVGGQTVEIRNKQVYVDGVPFENPPLSKFTNRRIIPQGVREREIFSPDDKPWNRDNYGPLKVPKDCYFMMGDNRDNSADSRYWGFLPEDLVVGKALVIYFSWNKYVPWSHFYEKIRWNRVGRLIH
jgi:signal peptidase I